MKTIMHSRPSTILRFASFEDSLEEMLQSLVYSSDEKPSISRTRLEWAQRGQLAIGLLWSLDNGQGNVLKRFDQGLGHGVISFVPWLAGQLGPLSCN